MCKSKSIDSVIGLAVECGSKVMTGEVSQRRDIVPAQSFGGCKRRCERRMGLTGEDTVGWACWQWIVSPIVCWRSVKLDLFDVLGTDRIDSIYIQRSARHHDLLDRRKASDASHFLSSLRPSAHGEEFGTPEKHTSPSVWVGMQRDDRRDCPKLGHPHAILSERPTTHS
ncbi:hypothetical protein K402DRAFT_399729 [Aulographum hederae CBS 113979]|uniref:Uncharacterized protein n=1 Tax=Aulographum hederae CBS 113979 TaxID=1176131 RepID=A0A6G1HFC7_9PEZI|nr:hypothetical protein K402DRAFT_399729 [Aulographum hederae CBS 113979]